MRAGTNGGREQGGRADVGKDGAVAQGGVDAEFARPLARLRPPVHFDCTAQTEQCGSEAVSNSRFARRTHPDLAGAADYDQQAILRLRPCEHQRPMIFVQFILSASRPEGGAATVKKMSQQARVSSRRWSRLGCSTHRCQSPE